MEENKDDLMSLFSSSDNFELNLGDLPEIDEEEETVDQEEEEVDPTKDEEEDNTDAEDESPEGVSDEDGEEEGSDGDVSPAIYSSLASVLIEQGLLPSLDLNEKSVKNVEDLAEVFKSEIQNQAKEYLITKIGAQGYEALEKGVSLQEYQQYSENVNVLDNINDQTLEQDLDLSKKVIYQDYINQGLSEQKALSILKKIEALGEEQILEDAKLSLASLKETEGKRLEKIALEREKQAEQEKAQQEKIDNDLKNAIFNAKEIIPGIKLNKAIKEQVYNSITKPVGKTPDGSVENQLMKERRQNPIDFDTKLYFIYEITKGFKDFSKLVNTAQTSAAQKLEQELRKTKFQTDGAPSFLTDPESYGGIGSELVL